MGLFNQQIREYAPIGNPIIVLGAAVQVVNFDFVTPIASNMLMFGASEVVTTAPANDVLLATWLANISITINGTFELVRDFTRAEYINYVQNIEGKEADLISNGNMLVKKFDPPIPAGTRIQIALTVNTNALCTAGAAVGNALRMSANLYDAQEGNYEKKAVFYQRIPQFPNPAGVILNVPVDIDLGTEKKLVKWLIIFELTVAALTDTFSGRYELISDGNTIARCNETSLKKHYQLISDGLAVPVGVKMMKLPGKGWNASQARTLILRAQAHTTVATGSWSGIQVLEKPYQ